MRGPFDAGRTTGRMIASTIFWTFYVTVELDGGLKQSGPQGSCKAGLLDPPARPAENQSVGSASRGLLAANPTLF